MAAEVFKANCLAVIDQVARRRRPVVITKFDKTIAKLVPVVSGDDIDIFGFPAGKGQILGDIVGSAASADEWECLK